MKNLSREELTDLVLDFASAPSDVEAYLKVAETLQRILDFSANSMD